MSGRNRTSTVRANENDFSDNSISGKSNEDADSDDSSWNEVSDAKGKHRSTSRPKSKSHKSGRKKSSKKKGKGKKEKSSEVSKTSNRHAKTTAAASSIKNNSSKYETPEKVYIKKEYLSDEVNSIMSDVNPPSLATRSKRRKQEIRQSRRAASSTSSALDSDGKKAKSEPIIITLDSEDSDAENVSIVTSLPIRTTRVRGEIMRKLNRMSGIRRYARKCSRSSSSSDSEKVPKKRKGKKSKATFSKKAKHVTVEKNRQKHMALKKLQKRRAGHIFTPMHQRHLKIRHIRKRFERQNIERRITPVRQSRLSVTQTEQSEGSQISVRTRRFLRNSSSVPVNYREEEETEVRLDRRKRRSNNDLMDIKEEPVESPSKDSSDKLNSAGGDPEDQNNVEIKNETSKESLASDKKRSGTEIISQNLELTESNKLEENNSNKVEETESNETKLDAECISEKIQLNKGSEEKADESLSNNKEEKCTEESYSTAPDSKDEDLHSNIEKDDDIDEDDPETDKSEENDNSRKIKIGKTVGRKKKIKPAPNTIRRKGRPRKIDSHIDPKPVVETFNILSVKPQTPFLQSSFCFDISPKLAKCRECKLALYRSSKKMYNSYCRFMEYRKLCYNKNGMISSAGFSNPADATIEHLNLWLPQPRSPPKDLNKETAKSLLEHIGDQFCDLIKQEQESVSEHIGMQQVITWKRVVQGVREMCDVCYTTIFNIHWVCPICGLAVCIDCYKVRKQGIVAEDDEEQSKDRDEFKWLLCSMRQPHRQDGLVMAQIIPGTALFLMKEWLHKVRKTFDIPSFCKCNPEQISSADRLISTGINKQLMSCVTKLFSAEKSQSLMPEKNIFCHDSNYDDLDVEVTGSALKWLDGPTLHSENANNNIRMSDDYFNSFEDFALLRGAGLINDIQENTSESDNELPNFTLDDIIASVTNLHSKDTARDGSQRYTIKHFSQRYPQPKSGQRPLPIRIYTKIESELAFPTVPHSWFCNGRLLFLHKANDKDNLALFQEQWKRGQPILVKSVDENLDMNLWHPDAFCRDFGDVKNDLVDCKTGNIIKGLPMKKFWEGFENLGNRLTDDNGEFLLLKLKDWPPGEDFSEKLPRRFVDLMKGLPLPEYTHRDGVLNLAGRLPLSFVRPDLGPKMYNAYGSALYPTKGTTNLHLDVSDAVNVMVYVGIPSDGNAQVHIKEALKAIDEGGCDSLMRARVRGRGCKPGALWHIYNARDADKIRDMLTKVAVEKGDKLEAHHDPIHDQSWYIDAELRLRLYRDYGVEGYAIAQCLGDAVFIPAGAPHQVRNLHSCVKVAEDFVSPENIAHCFKLTQEFRNLSDTHTNHEDKLQIKNIIYHVVKDSLSHLVPAVDIEKRTLLS